MRINIVAPLFDGWILRQIAINFKRHIPSATLSEEPDPDADVNFYINQYLYKGHTKCDIGFFTHREQSHPLSSRFDELAIAMDGCVAMCAKTASFLPPNKTTIITIGPNRFFLGRDIVLGVVGREYESGRKRYAWIPHLRQIPGVKIVCTNGIIPLRKIPRFYKSIDYLLILSDNEGGPIPLLEALGMGVPVISSDVGFVSNYSTLRYETYDELVALIKGLVVPKDIWETASRELVVFCKKVMENTPQRVPEVKAMQVRKLSLLSRIKYYIWNHLPFSIQDQVLDYMQNRNARGRGRNV